MSNKQYIIAVGIYVGLAYILALAGKPAELAGFAVVGALALVFLKLDSFKEFSGGGFAAKLRDEVKSLKEDLEPIKLKETEPDVEQHSQETPQELIRLRKNDEHAEVALLALTNGKYSWRSLGGITKVTAQRPSNALNTLELLQREGLAREGQSSSGSRIWGPTVHGSIISSIIEFQKKESNA